MVSGPISRSPLSLTPSLSPHGKARQGAQAAHFSGARSYPKALPADRDFRSAFLNLRGLPAMQAFCHILVLRILWFRA